MRNILVQVTPAYFNGWRTGWEAREMKSRRQTKRRKRQSEHVLQTLMVLPPRSTPLLPGDNHCWDIAPSSTPQSLSCRVHFKRQSSGQKETVDCEERRGKGRTWLAPVGAEVAVWGLQQEQEANGRAGLGLWLSLSWGEWQERELITRGKHQTSEMALSHRIWLPRTVLGRDLGS